MNSRISRHRRAVRAAVRAEQNAARASDIFAAGMTLERLAGIAEDRGWTLAVAVVNGRMTLHAFNGSAPHRTHEPNGWLMPPVGRHLALAEVTDHDYDWAAAELWAMCLQEWT